MDYAVTATQKEILKAFNMTAANIKTQAADITLDEVGLCKGQKFALHYDFGDDWMFTITVSKISEVQGDFKPRIIKAKGNIQQYPYCDEDEFDEA